MPERSGDLVVRESWAGRLAAAAFLLAIGLGIPLVAWTAAPGAAWSFELSVWSWLEILFPGIGGLVVVVVTLVCLLAGIGFLSEALAAMKPSDWILRGGAEELYIKLRRFSGHRLPAEGPIVAVILRRELRWLRRHAQRARWVGRRGNRASRSAAFDRCWICPAKGLLTGGYFSVYTLNIVDQLEGPAVMDVTDPTNCTCFGLRKAARAVTQMYDQALKPTGLRTTQFSLLAVTDRVGPRGMAELAEHLVMDRTTLTRNLKPLLDRGLLERVEGEDRRRRAVAITAKGRAALAQALPYWREVQGQMADSLGRSRWWRLLGDLRDTAALAQAG